MTLTAEKISEALRTAQTPFYIFDTDEAAEEIRRMHEVLPERVKVCFSIKANPYLTEALGKAADYVEACSFGELRICERKKVPEEKIVLSGVNKGKDDLLGALKRYGSRITYTAESLMQWEVLEQFAEQCLWHSLLLRNAEEEHRADDRRAGHDRRLSAGLEGCVWI